MSTKKKHQTIYKTIQSIISKIWKNDEARIHSLFRRFNKEEQKQLIRALVKSQNLSGLINNSTKPSKTRKQSPELLLQQEPSKKPQQINVYDIYPANGEVIAQPPGESEFLTRRQSPEVQLVQFYPKYDNKDLRSQETIRHINQVRPEDFANAYGHRKLFEKTPTKHQKELPKSKHQKELPKLQNQKKSNKSKTLKKNHTY